MTELKVIERINNMIEKMFEEYNNDGDLRKVTVKNAEIKGMIETLEMFTGKSYMYDENGVHVKE